MPDGVGKCSSMTVKILSAIGDVDAAAWDACAGTRNPFVRHAFLAALEESGAVSAETGWMPQHLAAHDGDGVLIGCAPLYLKSHSYGEYVFDWAWADAYQRAGGQYYPKLQAAVPFTPVPGPRLLLQPGAPAATADALAGAMVQLVGRLDLSSAHVTFAEECEWRRLGARGFLLRVGEQYHWLNRGYQSFDDFLAALSSRKRKAIRKERRAVADQDIRIRTVVGGQIEPRHWDAFYRFYRNTHARKWGHAYLNRAFFRLLAERIGDTVVMVVAELGSGEPIAGALNIRGPDALYGRYWGCTEAAKFLHFEVCYYRAIDFAIEHGLSRVEAGAQGPHKIQRGYLPVRTFSAHWIADARFRDALDHFLMRERAAMEEEGRLAAEASPYRSDL
ncbi:MAG: N-acetyltransferase [Rhodospirillales bacterium]|nr:N-acetyltransferase [Rhodospirillales bacterium]